MDSTLKAKIATGFSFKEEIPKLRARRELLEALLVASMLKPDARLPTIKGFILSEVVNGTIEYLSGKAGEVTYSKLHGWDEENAESELSKYFENEMKVHSGNLASKIREALAKLCDCYVVNPSGPDRPFTETEIYMHFAGFCGEGICPIMMQSTFSLPHDLISRVEGDVLPSFSAPERKDVKGIGEAMRKYIDLDLKYIREHYHW